MAGVDIRYHEVDEIQRAVQAGFAGFGDFLFF